MNDTKKPANRTTASDKTYEGFTDEERAAMKARAGELKAGTRRGPRTPCPPGTAAQVNSAPKCLRHNRGMVTAISTTDPPH